MASKTWLLKPQPLLKTPGVIVFLVLCTLLCPLSSDMYTPAIPTMVTYFHTTEAVVNLTLVMFFATNALGLLVAGPISDKTGRRPVLFLGCALFICGSLLCTMSTSIHMLIASRIVQALGGGCIGAVGTALVKDAIVPEKRALALSVVNTLFVVGPVLGPIVGAVVLQAVSWRGIFAITLVLGLVTLVLTLLLKETLPQEERCQDKLIFAFRGLVDVLRDKGFVLMLLVACLLDIGFMAYIAVGSYVYIDFFGTSELVYSLFFAANGVLTSCGPFLAVCALKKTPPRRFTGIILCVALVGGLGLVFAGGISPFAFCGIFTLISLTESCSRPYTTNILLEQSKGATGAAASIINFTHTVAGCIGMFLAVLPWHNSVVAVGGCEIVGIVAAIALWMVLLRSGIKVKGIQ